MSVVVGDSCSKREKKKTRGKGSILKSSKETVIMKQMRKKWSDKLMSEASMPDMDECWKPRDRN